VPCAGSAFQLEDYVATMREADSPYHVYGSSELKLSTLERVIIFPVAPKLLQPLQWRNSHDRSDRKSFLVAHRATMFGTQLKALHKILSGHLPHFAT
jgi:hypothetical protein